jgi:uncharacterized membrane protein YdjX (TVP38/TMEM64 family)/rhodanese-related sulfurtransferase
VSVRRLVPRVTLLALLAAAVIWATFNRDRLDPALIDTGLSGLGLWAPVAYVGLYAAGTVIFLPGSLFALAGGALFGPVWGSILNLVAATIGAGIAFLVARYVAGDWVARRTGGRLKRLIDGVEAEGWRFVAFVRLVPLFPFNLTNYALGLTRIGFWSYVATSFICMAPGAVAYTWLGHAGREAFAGNASAIRYGLLALGLLVAIAFLPRLVRRMRGGATHWIEPQDLLSMSESGAQMTIVDVRSPDEFTGTLGHIPDAINIPLGEIGGRLDELGSESGVVIAIICRTDRRSAAAAKELLNAGFSDVRVLRGGMERWNEHGFTTNRDVNVTPEPKRRRNSA